MAQEQMQVVIFILILIAVAVSAFAVLSSGLPLGLAIAGLLVLVGVLFIHPSLLILKEYERAVMFRLGKFHKVAGPGWVIYFSGIQTFNLVDLRTQVLDVQPQEVITQDNVKIKIDAVIYYRIVDPKKSVIEVKDIFGAIGHLLRAQLRTVIGRMLLEEVLEKTEELNVNLFNVVKEVEDKWGLVALRVEITSIELPPGLLAAFQRRREAGEYKEKLETEARAKQVSLEIIDKALRNMSDKTIAYLYLDVLKKVAEGKSNKIIFPLELSRLAGFISEKAGWRKGEDYENIAKTLVQAYQEQQKEALDSQQESKSKGEAEEAKGEKEKQETSKPEKRKKKHAS